MSLVRTTLLRVSVWRASRQLLQSKRTLGQRLYAMQDRTEQIAERVKQLAAAANNTQASGTPASPTDFHVRLADTFLNRPEAVPGTEFEFWAARSALQRDTQCQQALAIARQHLSSVYSRAPGTIASGFAAVGCLAALGLWIGWLTLAHVAQRGSTATVLATALQHSPLMPETAAETVRHAQRNAAVMDWASQVEEYRKQAAEQSQRWEEEARKQEAEARAQQAEAERQAEQRARDEELAKQRAEQQRAERLQQQLDAGRAHVEQQQFAEAVGCLTEVLTLDEEHYEAYLLRGIARRHLEQLEAAKEDFDNALYQQRTAEAYFQRGLLSYHAGSWQNAVYDFRYALDQQEDYHPARWLRAQCYIRAESYEDAEADLRTLVAQQPERAAALVQLGDLLYRRQATAEAMLAWQQAAQAAPEESAPLVRQAVVLATAGALEAAVKKLEMAASLDPENVSAHFNLGCCLATLGQHERAIQAFATTLRLDADDVAAYYNLANSLVATQKYDAALKSYSAAIQRAPGDGNVFHNRAIVYDLLGDSKRAQADRRQAEVLLAASSP